MSVHTSNKNSEQGPDDDIMVQPSQISALQNPVLQLPPLAASTVSSGQRTSVARTPGLVPKKAGFVTGEALGDPHVATASMATESTAGAHEELGNPGSESGVDFAEATSAELATVQGESAVSDLEGIEGFEAQTESNALEAEAGAGMALQEAGAALEAGAGPRDAEFAFLASLVPTLISSVGLPLAKAVATKLSRRTRVKVKRVASVAAAGAKAAGVSGKHAHLLSMLAKALESAESSPSGETSSVDEGLAAEAAAVLEVIIGTDDRVRITATAEVPWRRYCALRIQFPSGRSYRGTGFLIGARALATAGHCVHLQNEGGWARQIEVIPGSNGTSRPYGSAVSTVFRSVGGWVNSRRPESDYGCVVLPAGAFGGRNLGHFGFAAWTSAELLAKPAVLAGYPGDKPFAEMWGMSRKIKTVAAETLVYDIDTVGGQSGAPVYIKRNGERIVVGIHNYGNGSGNSATRITPPVYERLQSWGQL